MEEVITPTVLWSWLIGCSIWGWNQYRQLRWGRRQASASLRSEARPVGWGLFGLLIAALGVIILYWPGLFIRSWLLPITELNHPLINQAGLLVIRLAICWLVIATVHRERRYNSDWRQLRQWYWEPYHNRQIILAAGGLLLGLFMALSGGITASLCLFGWWLSWRQWQTYERQ